MPPPLEVPTFGPSTAPRATALGAARIELNATGSYGAGGLTPSAADVRALAALPQPVRVMIRPRGAPPAGGGADFVYTAGELAGMRAAIEMFRAGGGVRVERGDGFVFGVVRRGEGGGVVVDREANRALVRAAGPFACVFHRAFDDVVGSGRPGWEDGLDEVVECGFKAILTSGGPGNAPDNLQRLSRILERAQGRIEIIIGGGVRSHSVEMLATALPAVWKDVYFHSSCLAAGGEDDIDGHELSAMLEQLRVVFQHRPSS